MSQQSEVKVYKKRESILYAGFKPEGAPDFTTVDYVLKEDYDKLKQELSIIQDSHKRQCGLNDRAWEENQKLETLLGECEVALDQSLRQWDAYASNTYEDLENTDDNEGSIFRKCKSILQKLKAARDSNDSKT